MAPTIRVFVERNARAAALGTNRRFRIAASTRIRSYSPTVSRLLSTLDTDAVDTPASLATSASVAVVSLGGARLRLSTCLLTPLLSFIEVKRQVLVVITIYCGSQFLSDETAENVHHIGVW